MTKADHPSVYMRPHRGVLFDSNIVIDFLSGNPSADREIQRAPQRAISLVTWIEVMVGAKEERRAETRTVLDRFNILPITTEIAEQAVILRREHRLKLPDALILATAEVEDYLLLTRDTRDFPQLNTRVHFPYQM